MTTHLRRPAVAGLFYPDRADRIEADLNRLVEDVEPKVDAKAIVVPHAGWMYSGRVAGQVYGRVKLPRLAVLLGPNHTGLGPWGSVMTQGRWALPGSEVPVARELGQAILAASRLLEEDELAHSREHALEVQLPFLRRARSDIAFVPLTLMRTELAFCAEVGRAVAAVVKTWPEPVILLSSTDLNHYESQAVSNRKDRLAIDAILGLDPERLQRTVREHAISMCGIAPTTALLAALRELGGGSAALVSYQTSGDVSGDYDKVVGYCGVIIT
ncbi:MAG: AmmeMemoRadiSam system protein B [Candidatus Rokubacteria bacterium]|nr:AmmeMemoRadiSam system protein B [Candidatus Rokubacteria bacterium]